MSPWIPNIVFGILAIVAAGLGLLLPETAGKPLPQTIEDIEKWSGRGKRPRRDEARKGHDISEEHQI